MSDKKRNKRYWRNLGIALRGINPMDLLEVIVDNGRNYQYRPSSKRQQKRDNARRQRWLKMRKRR